MDWLRQGGTGIVLGGAVLLLAVVNTAGAAMNRSVQSDVGEVQAKLARARTVVQVDNALVQLLARAAAEKNDAAIQDLLARNGVTFHKSADASPAAVATPEAGQ